MSNQPMVRLGAVLLAFSLSACSGNQAINALPASGSSASVVAPAAARLPNGATALAITLPPIQPKGSAIDWSALPNSLSSATESVSGTIGKKAFGPIALSSSESSCQTSSTGLVCTVTVNAAAGTNVPVDIATYGKKTGTNDKLAIGTTTLSIFKGQSNVVKPAMSGIARSIGMSPQQTSLTQGFVANDRLAIYGVDAAKHAIPSSSIVDASGAVQKKFDIAFSGPVSVPKSTHGCRRSEAQCWGYVRSFVYDGLQSGTETIVVSVKGFPDATESVNVLPGTATLAPLLTQGSLTVPSLVPDGQPKVLSFISEFALDATGNVAPTRTFIQGFAPSYGEDSKGNFWEGATHLSNRGAVLGTVAVAPGYQPVYVDAKGHLYAFSTNPDQCTLNEYSRGADGATKLLRQITMGSCQDSGISIAVDRAGDVFTSLSAASPEVNEYPPTGSGALSPTRTIPVTSTAYASVGLDTDASGNLYVLTSSDNGTVQWQLSQFAPGATTGTQRLGGTNVQNFAVDDAGDIYGCVTTGGAYALVYFQAGSDTPSRTISGSNTMLNCDPILVPRS
jgi:hypothetical protein